MAKLIITTLEQSVLLNIKDIGAGHIVPQNVLSQGSATIKSNQVCAVVNNMIGKGLLVRSKDLFGNQVALTRSGKIQATKLAARQIAA